MSYLVINEDLKTVGHNLWTRFASKTNNKLSSIRQMSDSNPLSSSTNIYKRDNAYFDSMYKIPNSLKVKLISWCRSNGGSIVTKDQINKINKSRDTKSGFHGKTVNKASRNLGSGMMTTSTVLKFLSLGNDQFYAVYFTFDGKSIEDVKVLTGDPEGDFSMKELPQWNSVNPEEYKK